MLVQRLVGLLDLAEGDISLRGLELDGARDVPSPSEQLDATLGDKELAVGAVASNRRARVAHLARDRRIDARERHALGHRANVAARAPRLPAARAGADRPNRRSMAETARTTTGSSCSVIARPRSRCAISFVRKTLMLPFDASCCSTVSASGAGPARHCRGRRGRTVEQHA